MTKIKFKDPELSAKLIQTCAVVHNFCQVYNDGHKDLEIGEDIQAFEQPSLEPFEFLETFEGCLFDSELEVFFRRPSVPTRMLLLEQYF